MALTTYKKPFEISAKDLQKKNLDRTKKQTGVFDRVLERCYNKIKRTNEYNSEYCFFEFHDLAWGMPLYDTAACSAYVIVELNRKGFRVRKISDDIIFIDWRIAPKRKPPPPIRAPKKAVSFGDNSTYIFD